MHALIAAAVLASATLSHAQPAPPAPAPQTAPAYQADVAAGNAAFQKEDFPTAIAAYQAALAKGATQRLIHFRLGFALHVEKRYEEALKHHIIGAQIHSAPIRIDCLYNATCASALLGRTDEALNWFERAIDAGFRDTDQLAKDTDIDSLRELPRFKTLVAGIDKAPRLHQQMNFFLGPWTATNAAGTTTQQTTLSRPQDGDHAILSTVTTTGGGQWTGMLIPNPADRTWTWTIADNIGTTLNLIGRAVEPAGIRFEGCETSAAGTGTRVRITYTPQADGRVIERVEVTDDGQTWRTHHEDTHTPRKAEAPVELP